VDAAIVPSEGWHSRNCPQPEKGWFAQCAKKHAKGGTKRALVRWDRPVVFGETVCLDDSLAAKPARAIKAQMLRDNHGPNATVTLPVLRHYGAATTLGVEGFCHGPSFFQVGEMHNYDNAEHKLTLQAFRFTAALEEQADAFVASHGMKKYIAVHWRHGDLCYMAPEFMVPGALATEVHEFLKIWEGEHGARFAAANAGEPLTAGIDGLVLLTDNFMAKDVAEFQRIASERLGFKVVVYPTDGAPARKTFLDVVLAVRAHMFLFSNKKSFFSMHILMSRLELYGKSMQTNIDMQINSDFVTDKLDEPEA